MFEDFDFDYDQYGGLDGFDPTSGYTMYDHLDPSTMVGAPPSDGPNGTVLSKAELDGTNVFGANSVPGAYEVDGALAQLWRNFQGATGNKGLNDWLRYALAGATALNAFKTPNSNAATVGQPRTRPGLSAFQMATSPGGLNFTVNGRGANVAFAGGGKVKGALGALRGMFRSSDDLTEGRALVPQKPNVTEGALSRREFLKNTGASAARALPDATSISPVTAASVVSKAADAVAPSRPLIPLDNYDPQEFSDLVPLPKTFRTFYDLASQAGESPKKGLGWRDVYRVWSENPRDSFGMMQNATRGLHHPDAISDVYGEKQLEMMERLGYIKKGPNGRIIVNPKYENRVFDGVYDFPEARRGSSSEPVYDSYDRKDYEKFAGGGEVGALGRCCSAMAEGGPFVGYVTGPGGGQDDLVQARLSPGEYVFDADSVAALGDGSNEEGARRLDAMREQIRAHKRSAPPEEIPPMAAAPEQYLMGGQ